MVTKFKCGHVGKMTAGKVKAFIRVAEIRNHPVEDSNKMCPDCRQGDDSK